MTDITTKTYITLRPVALGNTYHADGVLVQLTAKQAEFLLASGTIKALAEPDQVLVDADAQEQAQASAEPSAPAKTAAKGDRA